MTPQYLLIPLNLIILLFFIVMLGCKPATPPPLTYTGSSYETITEDCGCTLLVRANIACCKAKYPDLGEALQTVYDEALKHREPLIAINEITEVSGDYENVVLDCGCALRVYVPDSSICFDAEHYPELVGALNKVYELVHKYEIKKGA